MKEKTTKKFEAINRNAVVGSRGENSFVTASPSSKTKGKTSSVIIKSGRLKKRRCSGCSRRRSSKSA